MVQAADKRLVTEAALAAKLVTEVDLKLNRSKLRLLGDQFDGSKQGVLDPNFVKVSLTNNATLDGYVTSGGKLYLPTQMYDIAECNWAANTLLNTSGAYSNMSKANAVGTCFDFTTLFEGKYMVATGLKLTNLAQDLRVWINDIEVTDWYSGTRAGGTLQLNKPVIPCVGDNINHYLNINFSRRGLYKVRVAGVLYTGTTSLIGCNAEGKFHKPQKQRVMGIISDSLYDTIPLHSSLNAGCEMGARMNWKIWNMSVAGSGFVNPSPSGAGNPMHYGSDNVFASLLKAPAMDLLLLNGSANDMPTSEATVLAAMTAFFTKWRTVRPDVPIVWKGIEPGAYFENTHTAATMIARENAMATVALADPSVIGVIRPALENWWTGTGNTGAVNGTGNQDFLIGADGIHLSQEGIMHEGLMVKERLASIPTWRVAA